MIIGFTGTRQGPTPAQHAAMNRLLLRLFVEHGATALIHGGAVGCDTFAHHVVSASGLAKVPILISPALEGQTSSVVRVPMGNTILAEPIPTLERNRIIAGCVDGLVAVPATDAEEMRSGTWTTIRYAREFGCPILIVRKDGNIVFDKPVKRCADGRIDETRFLCPHPKVCEEQGKCLHPKGSQ